MPPGYLWDACFENHVRKTGRSPLPVRPRPGTTRATRPGRMDEEAQVPPPSIFEPIEDDATRREDRRQLPRRPALCQTTTTARATLRERWGGAAVAAGTGRT